MKMRLKIGTALAAVAMLAGCQMQAPSHTANYEPVVDTGRTDMNKFHADLEACRTVAAKVEARYREEQQREMMGNILAGALTGALAANYADNTNRNASQWGALGAASGFAGSAQGNDYTQDFVKFGPRRIIDRCMVDRGHRLLNEVGRG